MEQTTVPEEVTVLAHVQSRAETPGGLFKVEVDIPSFGSQYPTSLNRVSAYDVDLLVPQSSVMLTLRRERQRGDGAHGDKPYGYWWGLISVEPASAADVDEAQQQVSVDQKAGASKNRSIDRAVALKAATEYAGYLMTVHLREVSHTDVLGYASDFDNWLHTGGRAEE